MTNVSIRAKDAALKKVVHFFRHPSKFSCEIIRRPGSIAVGNLRLQCQLAHDTAVEGDLIEHPTLGHAVVRKITGRMAELSVSGRPLILHPTSPPTYPSVPLKECRKVIRA
jgi:hypothetical protein